MNANSRASRQHRCPSQLGSPSPWWRQIGSLLAGLISSETRPQTAARRSGGTSPDGRAAPEHGIGD